MTYGPRGSWGSLRLVGGTMTGSLILAGNPSAALEAAPKQYVDAIAAGLAPKAALVATTANITLSGEQTLDGVLTSASRVLVKNQSAPAQNGIYVSAAGAWTRATDMDAWSEVPASLVIVETGTTLSDTGWVCTADPGGTLGTTAIPFSPFFGSAAVAGTANQVSASYSSGTTTLSIPSDFRLPGTLNLLTLTQPATAATLTLANNSSLITVGAFATTITSTATTNSTLPAGTHSLAPLDSPSFTTPALGVATATSIAVNGATPGTDALAWTGTATGSGALNVASANATGGTGFTLSGDQARINANGVGIKNGSLLQWGSSSGSGFDTILSRSAAATLQQGAADVASGAVAQTFTFQGNTGATTNGPVSLIRGAGGGSSTSVGGELRFSGGLSSAAAGTGGAITFYTAPAAAGNVGVLALTIDSTGLATFGANINANAGSISINAAGNYGWNGRGQLNSSAVNSITIGPVNSATPAAQTLGVTNVTTGTSNTAGANFTVAGSVSTGTGLGGSIIFQVSPAGTTGTSQNALATALTIDSTKLATFAGGVTVSGTAVGLASGTTITSGGGTTDFRQTSGGAYSFSFGAANGIFMNTNGIAPNTSAVLLGSSSWGFPLYLATLASRTATGLLVAPSDGVFTITNVGATDFGRLQFGGQTSSFPALKRNATAIDVRLADDSGYTGLNAGNFAIPNSTGEFTFGTGGLLGRIAATATDGTLELRNNARNGFGILRFGGATSSFPGIKQNGAALNFRLADDSADAAITAAAATFSGSTTYSVAATGPILKQGANGRCGTFVLNGSTPVTVSNTSVAINDAIIFSLNTIGGVVGVYPTIATITAATGFTVAGTAADTSTYNYAIIKNAA